jgi:hypothetical protein
VHFLVPDLDGVEAPTVPIAIPLQPELLPDTKGAVFLVNQDLPERDARLAQIRRAYPTGRLEAIPDGSGSTAFMAYFVERDALLSPTVD